ncbi:MAG: peptidyl-prolyl cis-trans isomerase [Myxococcales bacterium]|nr:MAG: peptidyl-prolyl cis-trans isomerase [Myxococcales bacterium]
MVTRAAAPASEFEGWQAGGAGFWARLGGLAKDPFVHFAVLGALVFAAHGALSRPSSVPTLEVSTTRQRELAKLFEQRQGRPPTPEEKQQLIKRHVEDEVLLHEGERLGLLQNDPMLRAELVGRTRSWLQGEVTAEPPSEAELLRYYEEHRALYTQPETISYREYWLKAGPDAKDEARRLSLALKRGEDGPELTAINYTQRTLAELSAVQDADLARRIWALPVGVWRELPSSRGLHVVRVEEHLPASDPPFSRLRERILAEYRKEQTARSFSAELSRLTSAWRVQIAEEP